MSKDGLFSNLRRKFGNGGNKPDGTTPPEQNAEAINTLYQNLVSAFSASLKWRLDDRFVGALAEFDIEATDATMDTIMKHLPEQWDRGSLTNAPKLIKKAIENYGGIQQGQLLFTSQSNQDVVLLGLWWPWSNGSRISIRFIPVAGSTKRLEESQQALKATFNI